MFGLPLHPAVVHLPIGLAVVMPLLAGGLALAIWKGWLPRRAWFVALAMQAVLVAAAFASMQTGEAEEDRVEAITGKAVIDAHEDAAKLFSFAAAGVLLIGAGAVAAWRKPGLSNALAGACAVASVGVLALGMYVGHLGGELVYKHGAGGAPQPQNTRAD